MISLLSPCLSLTVLVIVAYFRYFGCSGTRGLGPGEAALPGPASSWNQLSLPTNGWDQSPHPCQPFSPLSHAMLMSHLHQLTPGPCTQQPEAVPRAQAAKIIQNVQSSIDCVYLDCLTHPFLRKPQ